jgi:hypothetical protein
VLVLEILPYVLLFNEVGICHVPINRDTTKNENGVFSKAQRPARAGWETRATDSYNDETFPFVVSLLNHERDRYNRSPFDRLRANGLLPLPLTPSRKGREDLGLRANGGQL